MLQWFLTLHRADFVSSCRIRVARVACAGHNLAKGLVFILLLLSQKGVYQFLAKLSYWYHGNPCCLITDVSKRRICTPNSF